MINRKQLLFLSLAFVCVTFGCKSKSSSKLGENVSSAADDTLCVDSVVFSQEDTSVSCRIKVDYPQGEGKLADSVRALLNSQLAEAVIVNLCNDKDALRAKSFQGSLADGDAMLAHYGRCAAQTLTEEWKELKQVNPELSYPFAFTLTLAKANETPRYLTYALTSYQYLGGAHGMSSSYKFNIDKAHGVVLQQVVDTLQTKALQPMLRRGVMSYLRACGQEVKEQELKDILFIKDGIIPLPAKTPVLANDGVEFIYQHYEIGPYAMGMVQFKVSYEDIRPYLTAEAARLLQH